MTNQLGETGEPVADGFEYNSGRNDHFLDVAEIKEFNRDRGRNDPLRPAGHHAEDIDAVIEVLRSDWLTQGPAGPAVRAGGRRLLRRAATRLP